MSHWKSFGLLTFGVVSLLFETAGSADAQCAISDSGGCATEWSDGRIINLGQGVPADINNLDQVVGGIGNSIPLEWSGGDVINLGKPPGATGAKSLSINDAGQVVGFSSNGAGAIVTEWNGGSIITFGPGGATGINNAGQFVGSIGRFATEWSGDSVINLGALPGANLSFATSINDHGQVVGVSLVGSIRHATEWSDGKIIDLGGLPGSIFSVCPGTI
jgi:probable HAF family extracellular repeat protein